MTSIEFKEAGKDDNWVCPSCRKDHQGEKDQDSKPPPLLIEEATADEEVASPSNSEDWDTNEPAAVTTNQSSNDNSDPQLSTSSSRVTTSRTRRSREATSAPEAQQPGEDQGPSDQNTDKQNDPDTVVKVLGHDGIPPYRKFRLQWKDGYKEWIPEKGCEYCFNLVLIYVLKRRIVPLVIRSKVGFSGKDAEARENWVTIEEVVEKSKSYGDP